MQVRCPHCARVFASETPGIQPCPGCGQQINVPAPQGAAPVAAGARCAVHPERTASGTCPRCGNFVCDECSFGGTTLCPRCRAQVAGPAGTGRAPTPWERREELGLVQGLWQTWKQTLFEPERFWRSVEPGGSSADALFYAWALTLVAAVPTFLMTVLNFKSIQAQVQQVSSQMKDLPPEFAEWMSKLGEHAGAAALGLTAATVILYPLSLIIAVALTHLGCLLFGAGRHGFGATFRVVAYASAPSVVAWVPMVGAMVAGIYTLVLEVWGISRVQEVSVGRAVGAILVIPALLFFCLCGLGVAVIAMATGA